MKRVCVRRRTDGADHSAYYVIWTYGFENVLSCLQAGKRVCRKAAVMKTLRNLAVGTVPLWVTDVSLAQNGNMMNGGNGGMWNGGWMGGYGGYWVPILLVIVIVGLVVWVVQRKGK